MGVLQDILHYSYSNGGEGETSYAFNSSLQRTVIQVVKPVIEGTISDLFGGGTLSLIDCMNIVDLGCSSGPNSLLAISHVVGAANKAWPRFDSKSPRFQVFLNDLPGNDFNTIFKYLPAFYEKIEEENGENPGPCLFNVVPGSFHGRLFPSNTIHLFHSSYCLHFLSQVPKGLEDGDGSPLNKGNIYIARTSPPNVFEAYRMQFKDDFSLFLKLRSEEIINGGRAILTMMCRRTEDPSNDENCTPWKALAIALNDMVSECGEEFSRSVSPKLLENRRLHNKRTKGLIEEAKVDSFNVPHYAASIGEIKKLIEVEGSFNLDQLEVFEVCWDGTMSNVTKHDHNTADTVHEDVLGNFKRAKTAGKILRAATESMLECHFGKAAMDDLFYRFTPKAAPLFEREEAKLVSAVISMTKI
ncbi:hypothetical protein Scep_000654 [Stephania cephalantha]|uniref:Uncharacterized protein n=1 Tax=Stephania cephalantha TaxID=152367 RepID=A0AAP0L6I7_9MAGN